MGGFALAADWQAASGLVVFLVILVAVAVVIAFAIVGVQLLMDRHGPRRRGNAEVR